MDERHLIELLKNFTDSHDKWKQNNSLLGQWERCLNASTSDLEKLSQLLNSFPDTYLPILQTFISHLCNNPRATHKQDTLSEFTLLIITIVITKNIHHSDIPDFVELLHNCIELLWSAGNKNNNKLNQMMKNFFTAILGTDGVLEILVSSDFGRRCLKRILLDFKMIKRIEQEELLRAVDVIAALVEKCSEHKEFSYDLSKSLSEYKACITLSEVLRSHHNKFGNWNLAPLSVENEQNLTLLNMVIPQRKSDFPHFLQALDQRKINLFQYLMEYSPCTSCHKRTLIYFSPEKYFLEEEPILRLPFEFNDDDKLGPWDVLLSEDTIESLQQLEIYAVKSVMKKLGHISSGEWGKHELQCVAYGLLRTVKNPVYEVELPDNGLKILWSVDYGFSIRSCSLTQLVKIWAVTASQEKIRKILKNLSIVHQVYTTRHIDRCIVKQIGKDDVGLPITFEDEEGTKSSEDRLLSSYIDNEIEINDERLLEIHKMIVMNKFVPLSKNLFKSLVLGGLKFTFQISKEEYEIISSPASAIIIGRSGTGKTTCIVFRQITSYLNSRICKTPSLCDNNNRVFHKKQIFITVSPDLRDKVEEYFYKVKESAVLAEQKMTMAEYHEYKSKKEEEDDMPNDMTPEDEGEKQVIPFHQLEDCDFPLFITYDEFSEMLQKTYGINSQDLIIQQKSKASDIDPGEGSQDSSSFVNTKNKHFVDYKVFQKKYWPRLNDFCKQKFSCELVYSEFSIIKGLDPEVGYLSREDYRNISIKKYPVFRYYRDHIYDLFQRYEKMKAWNGHYDSIDRTLAILRRAKTKALGGPRIHEVYVDECQDNQIVDLSLILKIFNRADAIFFAGDIAQCIARGSSFRFEELNTLLYQWECTRAQNNYNQHNIIKPKQFELNINYRSHNEILKLASSVIGLIWRFFPNSIDQLSREHGEVGGPQPVIFDGFKNEHLEIISKSSSAKKIEFGTEQVIIVRDDEAKERVKKLIGKAGMILTIFQAKGMEFDDVLLYNFFTNSPACLKWRVILSALNDLNENSKGIQTFSHEKHYILSSEFKHLYVAITRARQHIWICEENSEYSMPIQTYWKHLGLIKITQSVGEIISTLAKKSSSHDWNQKGKDYFKKRQYEQAVFSFEKSGNKESYNLANAYYLWQIARDSINDSDNNTIKSNFIRAAQAFKDCSRLKQAASCCQEISMFDEAGDIYAKIEMFELAADCYHKAKNWYKAGNCFEKSKKYTDAISAYKNGNLYKDLIKFIQRRRQEIGEEIFYQNIDYIKVHCHKIAISYGEFKEAINMFICLIDNDDDIIEALQFLLHLCGINIVRETMADITNQDISQGLHNLLSKKSEIVTKIKSQSLKNSEQWKILMKKFQLYLAYSNKKLNKIHECIQFFRYRKEVATEFHAINLRLHLSQFDTQVKSWHEQLQHLLRLCELAFSFIDLCQNANTKTNYKEFKDIFDIFFVSKMNKNWQIPFDSPLLNFISSKRKIEKAEKTMSSQHFYNVNAVHQSISKFLTSYIYNLIRNADQKGRKIPNIGSQICDNFVSCNCQKHHVTPTPLILYQRLKFVCLQYTVIQQLDKLYDSKLLSDDQNRNISNIQRWWTERLVEIHIRYQSSQLSCPEVTYMVLAKLPKGTHNGFINKIWSLDGFKDGNNFGHILKCMFVFQQLQDKTNVNKFCLSISKITMLSHPTNLLIDPVISVGKRLSLFFFFLYSNQVIRAISHVKELIQHVIINIQQDNHLISSDTFGDLVSLIEFTISLIFASSPGYCDFCLPRAYLVNYFEAFTAKPLISSHHTYNVEDYLSAIKNSLDQVQQLLGLLVCKKQFYFPIILRLIRLLVLIGLNESTSTSKVFNLFNHLNNLVPSITTSSRVFPIKIKQYLEKKNMEHLVNVLHHDLEETGCDSLVIVYHHQKHASKFSNLEKYGITKLTYNSIKGFHSALQHIILSVITKDNVVSKETLELTTEIQAWFAAKKIQAWFRQIYNQKKFRKLHPILNKIYNEMIIFCQVLLEEKGREAMHKYNILLRGQTVDMVVKLIKLQDEMNEIKNKMQRSFNNCTSNTDKREQYLELINDNLKYNYYENVKMALRTLPIIKNSEKHKEANIEWLKSELQRAEDTNIQVREWINKCNSAMNENINSV